MSRVKKIFVFSILFVLLCITLLSSTLTVSFAKADENEENSAAIIDNNDNAVTPYGLFTSLTLTIDGSNGYVWATAENTFTLFPASVAVVVEIYSSDTYQDSHSNMVLENKQYINDLDMGKKITAKASTNGIQRYWKGRMYYKIDNKDWQEKVTKTWLCDADGIIVL